MATTLYLVRHGETEGSEVKRYKGSIDVPLSERGIGQMKKVSAFIAGTLGNADPSADYLKHIHRTSSSSPDSKDDALHAVYTSPLSRALNGAEMIAAPHGLKPSVVMDLRERGFGRWEGMSFTEIKEQYPDEFEAWAGNPVKYSPPGGESTVEVSERAVTALNTILDAHKDEAIAVVAHGGVNRVLLCHILGIPLENVFRVEQDFGAVNVIEFWEKYPVVKLLNYQVESCHVR